MPAARALPWLLAGVVLAGCARTGPGLPVAPAPAPDVLVDLRALDASIRIEMPYATPHNFTGVALYPVARCLLRREVAERLVRVERRLGAEGSGSWCGIATARSRCSSGSGRSCPTRATSPSPSSATAGRWRARSTTAARPWT